MCLFAKYFNKTYIATKSSPIISIFRVPIFVCMCICLFDRPLLIISKPSAQRSFLIKNKFVQAQKFTKCLNLNLSKQCSSYFSGSKTIENTYYKLEYISRTAKDCRLTSQSRSGSSSSSCSFPSRLRIHSFLLWRQLFSRELLLHFC